MILAPKSRPTFIAAILSSSLLGSRITIDLERITFHWGAFVHTVLLHIFSGCTNTYPELRYTGAMWNVSYHDYAIGKLPVGGDAVSSE
jgi:hypothetical protein